MVAPNIVITVPSDLTEHEIIQHTRTIRKVQIRFFFIVNFVPITSSIESFVGKTQNGAANPTTIKMPKSEMKITIGVFPFSSAYGA